MRKQVSLCNGVLYVRGKRALCWNNSSHFSALSFQPYLNVVEEAARGPYAGPATAKLFDFARTRGILEIPLKLLNNSANTRGSRVPIQTCGRKECTE